MDESYLLVGLGNPGAGYANTRHNLGFMIIDQLAQDLDFLRESRGEDYWFAEVSMRSANAVLAKPLTFMNRSGLAVSNLIKRHNISLDHLLIILDDFNLPFGKLRLRSHGSAGGHNGLDSIIEHLESSEFARLRIGIGKEAIEDPVTFVLDDFGDEERKLLPELKGEAAQACRDCIEFGIDATMNKYN